jgi:pimeloyl-ACP methyl ester carboxylesterase
MPGFEVAISEAALADCARRLVATRWLDPGLGNLPDRGADLAFVQAICTYWRERFDWRKAEARINAEPQVIETIDGLAVHAIHRRSSRADAIPLILLHGWPSSFIEFLPVCAPLAEPPPGDPAFHVVVPSLPGYGFSAYRAGMSPRRIAGLLVQLMAKLGHDRFIVQGGNWGSSIAVEMARDYPRNVIGLHLNTINASPPPADTGIVLDAADQAIADRYLGLLSAPHFNLLAQAPLGIAHALADSPAGLAGFMGERLRDWADRSLPDNPGLDPEWMVATIALTWLTGTAGSSLMLYRDAVSDPAPERFVAVPTAFAHFPAEMVVIPRPWAERHFAIARWTSMAAGGHYPATEVPGPFVADVRALATQLCSDDNSR